MKQLLIVKQNTCLYGDSESPKHISLNQDGKIGFWELGADEYLDPSSEGGHTPDTIGNKNFGIVLGIVSKDGVPQVPFMIPEVDVKSLTIVRSEGVEETAYEATFTMPTPEVGEEYTVVFVKKGTVPHERNTWTCTVMAKTDSATDLADAMVTEINNKVSETFTISASNSDATITVEGQGGEMWVTKFADGLIGLEFDEDPVEGMPGINDTKAIKELASKCAAGKGFNDTYADGATTIPGYPEEVAGKLYNLYTLRFKVGRDSSKTRDEQVWQLVHIAVPTTMTTVDGELQALFANFL